jgi:hypothetical protein
MEQRSNEDKLMSDLIDPGSIVFQAACNESVEPSMRPIRQRVVNRLADRCRSDVQVSRLFSVTWDEAENDVPNLSEVPLREKLVANKFINLIAVDPRWKTLVLNAIIQERRWSDLWSRGYGLFSDRLLSFFEKLNSPNHPATRLTIGALTSLAAVLLAVWIPPKVARNPDFYDIVLRPILKPFQSNYEVPIDLKTRVHGEGEVHLKVVVDDDGLSASIRPKISPNDLNVTFHPATDAPVRFTPQIQYPADTFEKANAWGAKPQGLGIRLIPTVDLSVLPKDLWDPKSGLKVSVTQLDAPVDKLATTEPTSSKAGNERERPSRPLDRIEADLETLSSDFQASKSDPQSTLVALQRNQNSIHNIVANRERTTILEATPSSVHSVVLQWVGDDAKPQSCTFALQVGSISADKLSLSITKEQCSSNISLVGQMLPRSINLGPGEPQQLSQWILSVDEMHRHWIFQHAATLRFTWQPAFKSSGPGTQMTQKLP